ncbi:NAD(P)H dehydrogenase, subunit NdhF3 family [Thalassoporum mexicanum PCC 7367]|uniref:NAD(P)H-quinone oxidoreductase subunit F n=1 Tax=Thalassoporum mexicanum TaxID=3457544 RepID=UPI00029F85A5|nr:NAD(P)H-quinone oxidoreductase subunit F [Pseudanabaena sp. PCC 7367]AFY71589.1 NAD(P)H dehydrogenase, subunit NdhF3 family [Pseudanabaena sp. PCC 7367]
MNNFLLDTIWLVPCYPLMGSLMSIFWAPSITRDTGPRPAGYVNIIATLVAFLHGAIALPIVWQQPAYEIAYTWLDVAGLTFSFPVLVSALTIGATVLITGVNLFAQIYAVGYLEMDWGWARFFAFLALFEAGMCSLVLCNSLFFSYIILEILTLGTYMLVGFWFNQALVVTGARDAFLTKRVGDLFLLMGVVALLPLAGTWNFSELAEWATTADVNPVTITLVGLALLAGPLGKCAQFPLHLWLDEAMEGPMPSTVLRNSLVVGVGAWVLIKLQPVLALSPTVEVTMITIGSVTALGSTLIAIAQIDIKRALSYLVSAYMGLAFIAVGLGETNAALMLLLTYSVAMATLITSVGNIVLTNITQDLTQMGGLWSRRPITGLAFVIGALALVAMPPFGCFWALLSLVENVWYTQPWLAAIILLINGLAAFSLVRVFGLIFGGQPQQMTVRSPEGLWAITLPNVIFAAVCLHVPIMLATWQILPTWSATSQLVAVMLGASSIMGIGISAYIYLNEKVAKPVVLPSKALQEFFSYDLYTAKLYRGSIVLSVDVISKVTNWFDRYLIDNVGSFFGLVTIFSGESLKYVNFGQLQAYLLTIVIGIGVMLLLLFRFTTML